MENSNSKKRFTVALVINICVMVLELITCTISLSTRQYAFKFYTVLSNIFAGITALIWVIYALISFGKETYTVPLWVEELHYYSTCCLTLTFLVAVCMLFPQEIGVKGFVFAAHHHLGFPTSFFHHLLLPIASIVSFICFEKKPVTPKKCVLYAVIPTLLYAVVSLVLNLTKVMDGPYFFLKVYQQPVYMSVVYCVTILCLATLLALALHALNGRHNSKN